MKHYEVIISGGGPVGIALALELGYLGIKTLIIEKHNEPQFLPKAQMLNPRSMEFLRRMGLSDKLKQAKLLPDDFPLQSIWCQNLCGEEYGKVVINENITSIASPENYLRIPLWLTEKVLREKITSYPCVTFIKNAMLTELKQHDNQVIVTYLNKENQCVEHISGQFLCGADGANSQTRKCLDISMQTFSKPQKTINVVFKSEDLMTKITLEKALLYFNLTLEKPAGFGVINPDEGLWYSQIMYDSDKDNVNDLNLDLMFYEIAGFQFDFTILHASFWHMQSLLADYYQKENVFLVGDAAHVFPPTGGHGLNTGLGDALNLAWKLAHVIKYNASKNLLLSYEQERKQIALRNLTFSKKNAEDALAIKQKYSPQLQPKEFAQENARIAKQHGSSLGVAMGYAYLTSDEIITEPNFKYNDDPIHYNLIAKPGFFAPHIMLDKNNCLYDKLPRDYCILTHDNSFSLPAIKLNGKQIYDCQYYLLRPDWHIMWCGNDKNELLKLWEKYGK